MLCGKRQRQFALRVFLPTIEGQRNIAISRGQSANCCLEIPDKAQNVES